MANNSNGIGILEYLGIAFVGLKLLKVIDWSWWWVTLPFWVGIPIVVLIFVVFVIKEALKGIKRGKTK